MSDTSGRSSISGSQPATGGSQQGGDGGQQDAGGSQKDQYFWLGSAQVEIDPSFPPVYTSLGEIPFVNLGEGIRFKPVFGRNLLVNFIYFEPHSEAPVHQHPEEQIGTILEGEYEFEMNGEKRMIRPGDVYVVPPNVPHGARTFDKPCVGMDIFSPPRSGFREMLERVKAAEQDAGKDNPVT